MDRKTLEYMESRAKQAREIVNTINKLKNNIESIGKIKTVRFINDNYQAEFDASTGVLTNEMKQAYIEAAQKEIYLLEQELAEL